MPLTATFAADFQRFSRSIADAQVTLRVFDRETKNAARGLTRELESISGQKVAAEAARMAEAVKRLGGEGGTAAGLLKLTDEELKRITISMEAARVKASRLGEALPQSLKDFNAEVAKLPKANAGFTAFAGKLDSVVTGAVAGLTASVVNFGVQAAISAARGLDEFVERGGKLAGMADGFVALSGGAEAADERLKAMRSSTQGLIGDLAIMQASNKAMLLGLNLNADQMAGLAETAAVLGRAMGQDATKSLDDLVTALGRSSPMILDNLGLTVKVSEANETYARALGKSASALTENEKRQAFMNAALNAASDRVNEIGGLHLNAADRVTQLGTAFGNAADASASWVVELGVVNRMLDTVVNSTNTFTALLREGPSAALRSYAEATGDTIPKVHGAAADALKRSGAAALDSASSGRVLGMSWEELTRTGERLTEQIQAQIRAAEEFQRKVASFSGGAALKEAEQLMRVLRALGGPSAVLPSQLSAMARGFEAAAEAARMMGRSKLSDEYSALARTLAPLVQFQQRYNVTIGEYVPVGMSAADTSEAVAEQMARLTGQTTKIQPPLKAATFAVHGFKEAVEEVRSDSFADFLGDLIGVVGDIATELDKSATAFQRLAQVSGRGMGRVAEAITIAATAARDLNDVLTNLAEGDKIGAGIAALRLGVNLAASLWDGLTNSAGEKAAREAGRDFGVWISEELGNAIAADADKLFGGDRFAASIFNLSDIIGAAGGLNADNLAQMTARLRDVFVLVQKGSLTAAQAVQVLDENWNDFVQAGTDAAGRLAPSLTEIIRLTRELGVASQEVQGYMRGQAETALQGVNAIINASKGQFDAWEDVADQVKKAQAEIDRLNQVDARGRGADWTKEMLAAQEALTKALGDQFKAGELAAGELENLGRIAMGTYAAAIEAGMSHNEALRAAAPGLSQIVKAYEHLGISAEDAGLKAFLAQAKFVESNPELLAGIDGLSQSFIALSNIGLLNADTFNAMQEAGARMYQRLLEQAGKFGLEGDEATRAALLPMQDYLREAAKQAELLGIPLDENTQKLIEQSKALGLWKDKAQGPAEDMRDAMYEIRDAVKELVDELKRIPANITTNVTTRYRTEGNPPGGSGEGSGDGSGPTPPPSVSSATNGASGQNITIRVPVNIDGRQVAEVTVPHIPAALAGRGL